MVPVSVVIITKNAADIVYGCIEQARSLTDDVIIIYNESDDEAAKIAERHNCRAYKKVWEGYAANKNKGIEEAKYGWILSIDADEIPDDELIKAIHQIDLNETCIVYDIKFRSYFGGKPVCFGSWGRDHHIRLFNRANVKWSETMVHETLALPSCVQKKKIAGAIHHYSVQNAQEFEIKGNYYAKLSAKKYYRSGKKANFIKLHISPIFGFIKNYIIYLGFLDGREGWEIAKITVKNTRRKYHFLSQMETYGERQHANDRLVVEY